MPSSLIEFTSSLHTKPESQRGSGHGAFFFGFFLFIVTVLVFGFVWF